MSITIAFILGIFLWPILEYLLHRFLGHAIKMNTLFKKEHTRHHVETNYFAPLPLKMAAAVPVCCLSIILIRLLSGSWGVGISFTLGFISMFSFYEWTHWKIHNKAPTTKLGMKLRKHHLAHHFHSPKMNHGVTSDIIDRTTGTYLPVTIVKVPPKINLPWLYMEGSDLIDPKYKNDFELR